MNSDKTEIKFVEESEITEVLLGEAVALPKMSGQLKRDRSVAKGLFTKKCNEISAIFEELTESSEVEKKLSELISSFEGLVRAHVLYHDTLTEKLEIEESNDYMRFEDLKFKELAHSLDKCKAKLLGNSENLPVSSQSLVTPCDSASQAGKSKGSSSVGSSISSTKAKLSAKKAGLLAKASTLGKLNEIEQKQLQLKQVKRELQIKAGLAETAAEEEALAEAEGSKASTRVKSVLPEDPMQPSSLVNSWLLQNTELNMPAMPKEELSHSHKESTTNPVIEAKEDKSIVSKLNPDARDWHHVPQAVNEQHLTPCAYPAMPYYSSQPMPYMQSQPSPYMQRMEELLLKQQQHTLALMLPQPELPTFGGNPIEYPSFIRAFESLIESRTDSSSARLYYLVQYTSGDVHELMRSCLSMSHAEGYKEARRLLKERYGQDYKIATAYVECVTSGPPIKAERCEDLRKFSILLTTCRNALKDIGYLGRMNNPDCLKKIINRLPFDMKRRWRDIADDISECQQREITIEDVALFVEKRARSASHPVFGDILVSNTDSQGSKQSRTGNRGTNGTSRPRASFGILTDQKGCDLQGKSYNHRLCVLCNNNHWLSQCNDFRNKSVNERYNIVNTKGLCRNCLVSGHFVKDCPKDSFCKVDGCRVKHSTFLHPIVNKGNVQQQKGDMKGHKAELIKQLQGADDNKKPVGRCGYIGGKLGISNNRVCTSLAIVPVKVRLPGNKQEVIETYTFLDTGSNTTFCTEKLMSQLHAKGKDTTISLTTLDTADKDHKTTMLQLQISDLDENNVIEMPRVFSTPHLPVTNKDRASQRDLQGFPHLAGVDIAEIDADVGLLIGSDIPRALEPKEVKSGQPGQPYATRTELGWVINGPIRKTGSAWRTANLIKTDTELSIQFERFCNMEFNDSAYEPNVAMSQEDKRALERMRSSIKLVDGHYQISLPWKEGCPDLPNNRQMAELRLEHLKKRLVREPILQSKYTAFMQDLLDKGFARRIPNDISSQRVIWFLPHHPVFHPKKPEKTRVVFDCSAKYRNTSLNGQLSQGPDLTNSLVGVLMRFRAEPIALMADIEGMFLQVKVPSEDANALQFLWWPDGELHHKAEEYQMMVHLFGAASSPSCASFTLLQTAEENKNDFSQDTINTVRRNFYVDDCLKSVRSEDQAIQLQCELRALLSKGGFHLTKFMSNSKKVLESLPESERAPSAKNLDLSHPTQERALGVCWDVSTDKFGFSIQERDKPQTRRGILSIVSSIYDPLGFAAPFILLAKATLQDLCRQKLCWDDIIPEDSLRQWREWLVDLPKLQGFSINRCVKPKEFGSVTNTQLHHFSDASQYGYGAVSYLRVTNQNAEVYRSLLMAKSRLAPIKPLTIPRLELSAAVVATRLDKMIRNEMDIRIDQSIFWTDSTCVLRYIENDKSRFQTFVANRIAAIREVTDPKQWRYVETANNPADDASRGVSAKDLLENKCWLQGPDFLADPEECWPKRPTGMVENLENDLEVKGSMITLATQTKEEHLASIDDMFSRVSSWPKLKKVVAWMMRYKARLLAAVKGRQNGQNLKFNDIQPITVEEYRLAEREIIKHVQRQSFPQEVATLSTLSSVANDNKKILKKSEVRSTSALHWLDPFLSEGLLRIGGRLGYAPISDEARHQIILPKRHHVVDLIVRYFHEIYGHSGIEYVLSIIRQRFWIVKGRPTIRRILNTCFSCRKRQAPVQEQKMAHLPQDRVTPSKPPFTFVGVDYFGPINVRRGRSMVKRYGVLFTCLSIRAVHIEIAHSLDTQSFINALRRFIARKGVPEEVRSDNGTNFVGGNKELRDAIKEWNQGRIEDFLLQHSTKWIFNPPAGSHHGGVWERCIRTTRKLMNAISKEQTLDDEGLITLMCEVESIINGRPLTKVSDDPNDWEALTPNHFLLLRAGPMLPPGLFDKHDLYTRRRWRQVQYLADVFWRRWVREYLPTLQQRHRWNRRRRNLSVNDIVLVADESTPRNLWPLGRILEVRKSNHDGLVRSVKLKTRSSVLERPIDKLVFLEGDDCNAEKPTAETDK